MKPTFYKIECITNLHVGSGDVNYNIVDNEVEKDITGLPMIHASGIKGALRDTVTDKNEANRIFGTSGDENTTGEGIYKFFDAHLIARPMRVSGSTRMASIPVVTVDSVNQFIRLLSVFGENKFNGALIDGKTVDFGDNEFLTNADENIRVEGDKTGKLSKDIADKLALLKEIIGEEYAVVKSFDNYALPVTARNCLTGKGNLWYEEVVPHGSVLYFATMGDGSFEIPEIVQFGGNSSIGCGFTKVTKI